MPPDFPAAEVLRLVGAVGPYFQVAACAPGGGPPEGFRPLRELHRAGTDTDLARRIGAAADLLGTSEARVAASVVHLGLAARVWSVALGVAAFGGTADLHPDRAHYRLPPGGPLDLWLPLPGASAVTGDPVEALHTSVVTGVLAPLGEAVRSVAPVAGRLLWGNTASALYGSLKVLDSHLSNHQVALHARRLAAGLLEREPLAGTAEVGPLGPPPFRRTTCCLYYRVPGGGLCGDCVLDAPPTRRRPR
ncbi:(2Fe-2S)-binding protein [Kitasatospora sp. MBT63]|uniref:(2Fe-2S)-binding protein n=1 Tax=Kitasatospora sp. MBT63 TaxID=1444768 RepID=UPI00053A0744|nr:(2Fe-2S)-binding protein [Kitasatospora sp. MBT63]